MGVRHWRLRVFLGGRLSVFCSAKEAADHAIFTLAIPFLAVIGAFILLLLFICCIACRESSGEGGADPVSKKRDHGSDAQCQILGLGAVAICDSY